jgi:5-methylthioadenosine/S-adenosylhomocysteine deaminase
MAAGSRARADILIRNGVIFTIDGDDRVIEGDVAITDGRISAVGAHLDVLSDRVIDARGDAVLPGFVNAHTHECMERGVFEDLPFMRWLMDYALPKDRAYEPRHMRAAALLNQLEMIQGGTTTFIDIFRFPAEAAAVAEQSGLRAIFSPQLIDSPQGVGESLESSVAFIEEWRDRVPDRIRTWFGPHALYSCEPETYERIRELADEFGVGIHTHLAESVTETEIIAERTGLTPTAYLDRLIGLGPDVLCAHCIKLTEEDLDLIAGHDAAVAHCPTSNMKIANGVAPIPELLDRGVRVGLATDSVMTNNNLDMFEEMRQAGLVQKLRTLDASAMPCRLLLRLATIGSANALGLGDEIGSLEVGKKADVIVVDLGGAHAWPAFRENGGNIAEQLVYACNAGDVRTTIVDGRILMDERKVLTLDPAEVEGIVDREARHLLGKAGVLPGQGAE